MMARKRKIGKYLAKYLTSFNGAAPMMARKHTTRRLFIERHNSFNGAAPMMARKHASIRSGLPHTRQLQWSRANDGAETIRPVRARGPPPHRFNGAAPMMARKPGRGVAVQRIGVSFNGAAPMMARKR